MAKIILTLEEVKEILSSNGLIPSYITNIEVEGDSVRFAVETGIPLLQSMSASVKYVGFENNLVKLEATLSYLTGKLPKQTVNWLANTFAKRIPDYVKVDYPNIHIDVDRLLTEKNVKGVRVEDVVFDNGQFTVLTCNA